MLVKYCATQLAFFILSRPVFGRHAEQYAHAVDSTKIMEDYSRNSGYLINLSQAVGRIVLAGRDLTRFAGFTSRVSELFNVLEQVNDGVYQRCINGNNARIFEKNNSKGELIEEGDFIEFDCVPIMTPSGDVLVEEMSFKVERGMNCLITGPNGCGKSSLFRILGGLWPLLGGRLVKPPQKEMFYVPQRPYLPIGTLRDQLVYPDTITLAIKKGYSDEKLAGLLEIVHLAYLLDREGGWSQVRDWADVLSGGEKQRIAMARLFYHCPLFAILDECTSAVSIDVEGEMYNHAQSLGITLFTISHRPSLFQFHEHLLKFDGQGGYTFTRMDQDHPFAFQPADGDAANGDSATNDAIGNDSEDEVMFYFEPSQSQQQSL